MLLPTPPAFQKRRGRTKPTGPVLLAGTFDYEDEGILTLTFDRPIALRSFDGAALVVNDPRSGGSYRGSGTPTLLDPITAQITTTLAGTASGTQTLLTAAAGSGIVEAGDGDRWAGVNDFGLSLPH